MGRPAQRVGDANSGGGVAIGAGHNDVLINGRPALKPGGPFTPHTGCNPKNPIHCFGAVAVSGNSTTVKINGIPMVLTGAGDTCGHPRAGGSPNVKAV